MQREKKQGYRAPAIEIIELEIEGGLAVTAPTNQLEIYDQSNVNDFWD